MSTSPEPAIDATASSARRPRGRPAVGRSTPLAYEEILDRAQDIVDAEGLDALSMRRLARDLGVTPMAIYHHVTDKPALVDALIQRVWASIGEAMPPPEGDPTEYLVRFCVITRETWLDNVELARLSVAVAEPNEALMRETLETAVGLKIAGFPNVATAYTALQTYTMGSIAVAAIRRNASAYFGRDPDSVLATALKTLRKRDASVDQVGVMRGRFRVGEDETFESGLRALISGLLNATP